jgi:UDP-N-acetyl-alpha-D-muramoyl-L-alanyl-L-glutamate epimerase
MHPGTFTYVDIDIDVASASVRCRYDLDGEAFEELAHLPGADLSVPGAEQAAQLYCLLAGTSYYKVRAPEHVDLGPLRTTAAERAWLHEVFVEGLGEFAWTNGLDLAGLELHGPEASPAPLGDFDPGAVLIPFGGGIDSIVTVAELAPLAERAALFVAERPGDRFAAIECTAELTGLAVLRAERRLDPKVLDSGAHGYLNGHVPVTGILSGLGVLCAVAHGFGALAMSNERSASAATLEGPRGPVNHQWSKGRSFEAGFRAVLAGRLRGFEYFSWLRGRSELSVAEAFARLEAFHPAFRSCNANFRQDPAARIDGWCARCDKCLFIDLVLAPFLGTEQLRGIFGGTEPLEDPALVAQLEVLVGLGLEPRPFECVGDEAECAAALVAAAARPDRAGSATLQRLAGRLRTAPPDPTTADHFIPERYASRAGLG